MWSGRIKSHDTVWNAERGEEERIAQVFYIKGNEQEPDLNLYTSMIKGYSRSGQVDKAFKILSKM